MPLPIVKPLTQYGLMAEKHWRQFLPRMVARLETSGELMNALLEVEKSTLQGMETMQRQLMKQGLTPQQAHDVAWEMVREQFIFLPPEKDS